MQMSIKKEIKSPVLLPMDNHFVNVLVCLFSMHICHIFRAILYVQIFTFIFFKPNLTL